MCVCVCGGEGVGGDLDIKKKDIYFVLHMTVRIQQPCGHNEMEIRIDGKKTRSYSYLIVLFVCFFHLLRDVSPEY